MEEDKNGKLPVLCDTSVIPLSCPKCLLTFLTLLCFICALILLPKQVMLCEHSSFGKKFELHVPVFNFFLQPWDQSFRNRSTLLFVVCVSFPAERSVCLLKRVRMSHNIAYRSVFHLYLPIIHKLKLWSLSVLERRLTDLSLFWVSLFFYRIYLIANYI